MTHVHDYEHIFEYVNFKAELPIFKRKKTAEPVPQLNDELSVFLMDERLHNKPTVIMPL